MKLRRYIELDCTTIYIEVLYKRMYRPSNHLLKKYIYIFGNQVMKCNQSTWFYLGNYLSEVDRIYVWRQKPVKRYPRNVRMLEYLQKNKSLVVEFTIFEALKKNYWEKSIAKEIITRL